MVKDITKTINELRCIAVERCRERLDQAAEKARGLLPSGEEQYGVTSLMKRKHGL
jgi:hypothetical protein